MASTARPWLVLLFALCLLQVVGCEDEVPSTLTGPWDIIFLDAATGEKTGETIRQDYIVDRIALSADEIAVICICRKALPGAQVKERESEDDPRPRHTGILREWDVTSGKLIAEREDKLTSHSVIWPAPRGKRFITATHDRSGGNPFAKVRFLLWDYSSDEIAQVARYELAPRSNVTVAFADDGESVVMCGSMYAIELDKENLTREDLVERKAIWALRKWNVSGGNPIATTQVGLPARYTKNVDETVARAHL